MSPGGAASHPPPLVLFELLRVPPARVGAALVRMATDRRRLAGTAGLRFWKLLGTGDGRTFDVRDADPRTWAVLTVWDDDEAAQAYRLGSPVAVGWRRLAAEAWTAELEPIAAHGRWSGREPFGPAAAPTSGQGGGSEHASPRPREGPVAAITRARLDPRRARTFWRAVPPVTAALANADGVRLAVGIGEAPVGLQGTFSLWARERDLVAFAYRDPAHVAAVEATPRVGWYREELFARFRVRDATGTFCGHDPLGADRAEVGRTTVRQDQDRRT